LVGAASDFDLWFHYGYRKIEKNKKFLRDATSQARPYAQQLLARQRQKILRGNVNLIGNPGYRLGDVVFIESRGLLFYVSGVSQNFSWGSDYGTSLELTYGHAPGVWIPNPWDVISGGMWRDVVEGDVFVHNPPSVPKETDSEKAADVGGIQAPRQPPSLTAGSDKVPETGPRSSTKLDVDAIAPPPTGSTTISETFGLG